MALENIDKIVQTAVTERVQASIIDMLSEGDGLTKLAEGIVDRALHAKVKTDHYREVPFIQKVSEDVIHGAARTAINQWVENERDKIHAEIVRQLSTKQVRDSIASDLVNSLVRAASEGIRYNFKLELVEPKRVD